MARLLVGSLLVVSACSHGPKAPAGPPPIALEPNVDELRWYHAPQTCAQGPFEVAVPATGAKYGEDVELQLHTARKVAIDAVVLADGVEVDRVHGVYDGGGASGGKPDNARCIADAHERLALGRTGTGGGGGEPGTSAGGPPPTDQTTHAVELQLETQTVTTATSVVHFHVPTASRARITIKFWSIEPNDLDGVRFGVAHVVWRPNVPDAQYAAHLAQLAADEDQRRRRAEDELRRRPPPRVVETHVVVVHVDPEVERRAREDQERRRAIAAALEADRVRRRHAFCAAHHADRDCWGPGGYTMHAVLDEKRAERAAYCAAHAEDARCWSEDDRQRRITAARARIAAALEPPKQPDGPPPAPLDETPPPKLSLHADWRPGYWQWTESRWVWLAGMWRVPDADIAAETTTIAPAAPPPPRTEAPPSAPIATMIWLAGFWQWSGQTWVWVPGSWQLRPEPRLEWRAPEWRVRGAVHVLVPGGWVRR